MSMDDALSLLAIAFGISMIMILRGPVGAAIAHRIANRSRAHDGEETERLAALESRLAEVEERLDFTERLLASAREKESLPEGADR
jgi:hypothetical protein